MQKERNAILNNSLSQAAHFGAVIVGQGNENDHLKVTVRYDNSSGLPIRDVYLILMNENKSLQNSGNIDSDKIRHMNAVNTDSNFLIYNVKGVDEKSMQYNYYVATIFQDPYGKYWKNDKNGLKMIKTKKDQKNLLKRLGITNDVSQYTGGTGK